MIIKTRELAAVVVKVPSHVRHWTSAALDFFFPPQCELCCRELSEDHEGLLLCLECQTNLSQPYGLSCPKCSAAVPILLGDDCPRCRKRKLHFDVVFSMGLHQFDLRDAVLQMKRKENEPLSASVGRLMSKKMGADLEKCSPDIVVPVPMHWVRRIRKGTNAAELLAGMMAKRLRIPAALDLLKCRRNIKRQSTLSSAQRFQNVHRAYRTSSAYNIKNTHVLVMDDVLTTGATCSEAARALLESGASKVTVAVAARAVETDW